jgi:cobalt/nickel transport system ATP-binding protein
MQMSEPAAAIQNLSIRYHSAHTDAIKDCSFAILPGERIALLGLNASGKTSLLLAIAGLVDFRGSIRVCGIPSSKANLKNLRRHIGFLFSTAEDQILFSSVITDVAFGLIRDGMSSQHAMEKAHDVLRSLDADTLADRAPYQLSHGERLRVALAGTLVTAPGLLLLDEPSTSLDIPGKKHLVAALSATTSAILMATHDIEFARRVCTRYVLLENGNVVRESSNWSQLPATWSW